MEKILLIENYVKDLLKDDIAHEFGHIDRVRNSALKIAKNEKFGNLEMVEATALLHDIGYVKSEVPNKHGEVGAEMARKFLEENNFFVDDEIDEICNAIRFHNKNRGGEGELLDILRDADMIDMFGAIGIMRALTSKHSKPQFDSSDVKGKTWEMSAKDFDDRFDSGVGIGDFIVDQVNFQISCYDNLKTETAKEYAKFSIEFMKGYLRQLEFEVEK